MSKAKIIGAALLTVFALGAVVSASASAAEAGWMVNGTKLVGSEEFSNTAMTDEHFVLTSAGVTITCTGNLTVNKGLITAPNKDSATSLVFTHCTAAGANCTIEGEEIPTVPISSEATLEGSLAVNITYKPQAGTVFSTIKFLGSSCALKGVKPVTGTVKALAPTGQDERQVQLISPKTIEGELKLASSAAELKGSALLELKSKSTWSFL